MVYQIMPNVLNMMRAASCSISFLVYVFSNLQIIFCENETAACIIFFVSNWAFCTML